MCIIAIKQAGVAMPTNEVITEMWWNNRDGAGIMYPFGGKVRIIKGLMTLGEVHSAIKRIKKEIDVVNTPIIMHFRIGTHGGNTPENTHPFPVTDKIPLMQKPLMFTNLGVAHNGIIYSFTPRKGISDTMEYIASQMSLLKKIKPDFYKDKKCLQLIANAIDSKMAFLDKDGYIATIGLYEEGTDGIWYSNGTYKPRDYSYLDDAYYGTDGKLYTYARDSYGNKGRVEMTTIYGMFLEEEDGYIKYSNGTIGDIGDHQCYVLGEDNNVYFETTTGTVIRLSCTAYTHAGFPMKFKFDSTNDKVYDFFYVGARTFPKRIETTATATSKDESYTE